MVADGAATATLLRGVTTVTLLRSRYGKTLGRVRILFFGFVDWLVYDHLRSFAHSLSHSVVGAQASGKSS